MKENKSVDLSCTTFAAGNLQEDIYQQAQEHAGRQSAPWRADYRFSGDVSKLCMENIHNNRTKKSPLHKLDFQHPWFSF